MSAASELSAGRDTSFSTEALAAFVLTHPASAIPTEALDSAERAITDALACILAGSVSEEAEPLHRFLADRPEGPAQVIGANRTADAPVAALINGTFGHALDFDDVLSIMPAHPSVVVLPALLAAAPADTTGRHLLESYILGVEAGARLGIAITNGHYRRGWHATGTLAIFSAVAALGRLRDLPVDQLRTAFGIAASMSSGLQCNFGTMTKPFHAGWASHNAVVAADLAAAGFTANGNVFESPAGFFSTYGTPDSDLGRVMDGIGAPFAIVEPGLALKKYPCCYALHRPIDAMLALRTKLGLDPENVERVLCRVAPGALRPLIHSRPETGLEAKFSLEYTLAVGVLDGRFDLAAYDDGGPRRPEIRALLPLMEKSEDPDCYGSDSPASQRSAGTVGVVEVTAFCKDGRSATERVEVPTGSPRKPLTWDDIHTKFIDCGRHAGFSAAAIDKIFDRWRSLRNCARIGDLIEPLRGTE